MVLARGVWLYSFRIRLPIATMSLRLAFVSNLFPDRAAPYFGLDNATVLHWLAREHGWDIRVICPRPSLSLKRHLKPGGGLLCEVGRCRETLEAAYPDLDFLWIDTEESSGEVFWVTKEQLEG